MIYTARQIGQMGEIAAARYLRDNGYSIVCANFRAKTGEIDLVASKGNVIAFCEVKTRKDCRHGRPSEYVTYSKRQKLIATALLFVKRYKIKNQMRFDVLEVILPPGKTHLNAEVTHIKAAFDGEDTPFSF